jgi:hypothetical protein
MPLEATVRDSRSSLTFPVARFQSAGKERLGALAGEEGPKSISTKRFKVRRTFPVLVIVRFGVRVVSLVVRHVPSARLAVPVTVFVVACGFIGIAAATG